MPHSVLWSHCHMRRTHNKFRSTEKLSDPGSRRSNTLGSGCPKKESSGKGQSLWRRTDRWPNTSGAPRLSQRRINSEEAAIALSGRPVACRKNSPGHASTATGMRRRVPANRRGERPGRTSVAPGAWAPSPQRVLQGAQARVHCCLPRRLSVRRRPIAARSCRVPSCGLPRHRWPRTARHRPRSAHSRAVCRRRRESRSPDCARSR